MNHTNAGRAVELPALKDVHVRAHALLFTQPNSNDAFYIQICSDIQRREVDVLVTSEIGLI